MKTSINLYHASCQPQKLYFSLSQLVILLMACVVFSGLAAFTTIEVSKNSEAKKISAQSELLRLQSEFTTLLDEETKRNAAEQNTKVKKELLQSLADKQHLLTSLEALDLAEGLSFPDVMLGLSATNSDKLMLTGFSILNNKLNIQGQAKQGELIPQWLARMQTSPELKAVAFDHIQIIKQNGTFLFQVNNINSVNQGVR
ncbi:PilN domain-containing protein [Psychromonas algicola]|uniref:PilN domain-containing protein n=1 Tax=Psychromonas algicola TaxID=2555642 RepID=UPI001067FB8F|nr:PilN domain-containing protein [Psychromonas sp. RZ5]TEW51671.1 hypothetical protein E2R67_06765 [Psychromonas sp. RZ5]